MDMVERFVFNACFESSVLMRAIYFRIIREATAKSKDGRIDQSDFLNHAAANSRYSLFTPMEASIVFHFAGRGSGIDRLALIDFAQLLDPRWRSPHDELEVKAVAASTSFLHGFLLSAYSFVQGGQCIHNGIFSAVMPDKFSRHRGSTWGNDCLPY
jgi:hypothetical protein